MLEPTFEKEKDMQKLPDGSVFFVGSFPLPKDHWLYAPNCAEWDVRRACQGAQTLDRRSGPENGQRCRECGTWVRDDMTDHPFFGFKAGCQR